MDRASRPGRRRRRAALLRLQPAESARGKARSAADRRRSPGARRRGRDRRRRRSHRARRPGRSSRRRRSSRKPTPATPPTTAGDDPDAAGAVARRRSRAPREASASCATSRSWPTRTTTRCSSSRRAPEYTVIEAALKKLDVPSRQVAIEVTIASVTLTDELDFGVEWLFKGASPSRARRGRPRSRRSTPFNPGIRCRRARGTASPGLGLAQGFTYIINNANFPGGVQAVLHLLDTYGDTKVVANPHLAALDNQKATIKAGNKIPINQQTLRRQRGQRDDQRRHDDVAVHRHRRAAAGDAAHQRRRARSRSTCRPRCSDPGRSPIAGDAPPINTRSVQTIVSVQSGQTMVMGGLIGETTGNSSKGLPLLVPHPHHRRLVRGPAAHQEPHRARDVHHAARRRKRERPQGHDRGPASPNAADRRHVRRLPKGQGAGSVR